jgi:PAS domain S-box-containing protein
LPSRRPASRALSTWSTPTTASRVEGETNCFLDRGATAYSHTFRIVRPDGALRIVVDRGVIERDPDGRVHRIRGMNVDLTEMQSAMPAGGPAATARPAAGGAAELESLYAEAPLGLAFLDREMRVVRINRALAEINGFTPEAHLGRTVWDLVPDLRESAEPALLHVLESGEPLRNVRIRGKTHAQPGVLREWREHFYPLRGADGRVQGIGVVCEEITDRVAVYNALAESERRFKLALSGSPITVFEHDADLRYGWLFNSKLGYSDTFALGKTDHDIMDPAVANVLSAFKRRVLESGEPARKELAAAAPGAPLQYYDLLVHPSRDEKGNVTGLICVSTDITEKKRAEEALRAAHDTFRQLVEGSPFGVYAVDADFRLVQVSEGAQKVFETVRPLLGRDFAQVLRILWPEPFASETSNVSAIQSRPASPTTRPIR